MLVPVIGANWWARPDLHRQTTRFELVRYAEFPSLARFLIGTPDRSLTCNFPVRSRALYMFELREQTGTAPRTCTGTGRALNAVPLHWASAAENGCPGWICTNTIPLRTGQAAVTSRGHDWCPCPDFHRDHRLRTPALCVFELQGQNWCARSDSHRHLTE